MPVITHIGCGKKASIFIDGQYFLSLSWDILASLGLKKGESLSQKRLEEVTHAYYFNQLYNKALRLLSMRPRSSKEINDKLIQFLRLTGQDKTFQPVIQKVIAKLTKQKLLNDEEFARWWAEQRNRLRPVGRRRLEVELIAKGVDIDIINKTTVAGGGPDQEEKTIKQLLLKQVKKHTDKPLLIRKKRLLDFLYRRGFDPFLSRQIVDQTLGKG